MTEQVPASRHRIKRNLALCSAGLSVLHIMMASAGVGNFADTLAAALSFYGVLIGYWATMASAHDGFGKP